MIDPLSSPPSTRRYDLDWLRIAAFALLILVAFAEALRAMASRDRLVFAVALGTAAGLAAFVVSAIKEPGSLGSARPGIRTLFLLIGVALAVGRIRRRMLF